MQTNKYLKMKNYNLTILISDGEKQLEKNISLQAENPSELSEKINSLKILSEAVNHEDLMSTVELIHEKPDLIPVVKNMIEEGDKLSETQMMMRLPKYVKQVMKVLKGQLPQISQITADQQGIKNQRSITKKKGNKV